MLKHRVSNAGQHGAAAAAAKNSSGNQIPIPTNNITSSEPAPPCQPPGYSSGTVPTHVQIDHTTNTATEHNLPSYAGDRVPGHFPSGYASDTVPIPYPIGYASDTQPEHSQIGYVSEAVPGHNAISYASDAVSRHNLIGYASDTIPGTNNESGTITGHPQTYDKSAVFSHNIVATVPNMTSSPGHQPVFQNSNDNNGYYVSPEMCSSGNEVFQYPSSVEKYSASQQQQCNTKYVYPEPVGNDHRSQEHSLAGQNSSAANQSQVPMIVTTESRANEGVRVINEKYDSLGKLSPSPTKSPLGSPLSDGSNFSFTDIIMSQKFRDGVTEQDLLQVDTFYRSHKSEVYVCGCLANLYFGTTKASVSNDQWTFLSTGIPLLLLNTGEHHRERKLFLILAEKGTGFTLWREVIDNLTSYKTPNVNFHTMHISKDHTKLAGLSFDDASKAKEFYGHFEKLTADPEDDLLKIGGSKKKKSIKDKKKKIKLPKKTEISQPCCFVHVTKLDRPVSESDLTKHSKGNPNEISAPFNFHHVTGTPGSGNDAHSLSGSLPNIMGSKLTLASTNSVDSGLSEDRHSSRTTKS